MPKVSTIQSNFNGGEISPLLYGRVDVPRYKESLAICQNYIPVIQGPIVRRPGTAFVGRVKDQSKFTRLVPFVFSTTQAYILEFSENYTRFYTNNALVTSTSTAITAVTKANPGVVTSAAHGLINGDSVIITGILGMTELNNREFTVANKTANTFELLGIDTTGYTTYTSGGTVKKIYQVGSYFQASELPDVQFAQSNDVLYITHPSYPPQTLTRFSTTSWQLNFFPIWRDGPYYDEAERLTTTLTLSAVVAGLSATLTASGVTDINGGSGWLSTDGPGTHNGGRQIRLKIGAVWTWATIFSVISTTVVHLILSSEYADTNFVFANGQVATHWRLGLWSDTDGWPNCVTFHEDRLVFGGAGGIPNRLDGSYASDYNVFSPTDSAGTVAAAHAYSFTLNSNDLNSLEWMLSEEQGLMLGTAGAEWVLTSADAGSALSALSVSAKKATSFGSEHVQAIQAGKCAIFVQRGKRKLRELNYFFDVNGFRAADLTQMAEHIAKSGMTFLAVQKLPQPIVWATRTDGTLIAMTYERDLDALKVGWSRHVMGGTSVLVESVAVIPSADGTTEDVWVSVKRTINGSTARYVEYITEYFATDDTVEDSFFVDSGAEYSGAATITISGINHLIGQSVYVLADGNPMGYFTVNTHGRITLPEGVTQATIGLTYESKGQKLRSDAGATDGTAMGKTRRTHRAGFQLLNTLGFTFGPSFTELDEIELNNPDDQNYDVAQGLYTGIISLSLSTDYDLDNMFCWKQTVPLPGTILGIYPQQVTQDRG